MEEKPDPDYGNQIADMPLTGGCQCGAVRYESSEPPVDVAYCHCRKCQRAYGSPFGVFAFISAKAFNVTRGEPKYYRSSAWSERGFCADCGTPLFFRDSTQNIGLLIGALDHPESWPPTLCHSGMESRIEWDGIVDDLPRWRTRSVRPPGKAPLLDMVRQHDKHLARQHDQRQPPAVRTRMSPTRPIEVSGPAAEAGSDDFLTSPAPDERERTRRQLLAQQVAADREDSAP